MKKVCFKIHCGVKLWWSFYAFLMQVNVMLILRTEWNQNGKRGKEL